MGLCLSISVGFGAYEKWDAFKRTYFATRAVRKMLGSFKAWVTWVKKAADLLVEGCFCVWSVRVVCF